MSILSLLGTASGIRTYLYAGVAAIVVATAGFAVVEHAETGAARAGRAQAVASLQASKATVTAIKGQLLALQEAGDAAAAVQATDQAIIARLNTQLKGTYHADDYTQCLAVLDQAFPAPPSAAGRVHDKSGR